MKLDQVPGALRHRPFRPLVLCTDSGDTYPVNHPEGLTTSPSGRTVGVILADETFVLLDVEAIRAIEAKPSRVSKRRPEPGT
jgi:hypothetical protein